MFASGFLSDTEADDVFPRIPAWLTDRKRSAFGKDAMGRVKIRDYARLNLGPTLEAAPRETLPIGKQDAYKESISPWDN